MAVVAVFFWLLIAVGFVAFDLCGFYFILFLIFSMGLILGWVLVELLAGFDCEGGVWF